MADTKFREFEKKDAEEITELFKQLTDDVNKLDVSELIGDPGCHCRVIEHDGKIIGFGCLIIHQIPTKGKVARVEDVVVHMHHRGKGLGKSLMNELITIAKGKGARHIDLTSNPTRVPARKLYESLGFKLRDTGVFRMKL